MGELLVTSDCLLSPDHYSLHSRRFLAACFFYVVCRVRGKAERKLNTGQTHRIKGSGCSIKLRFSPKCYHTLFFIYSEVTSLNSLRKWGAYSWFATTWQGGHVGGQNKRIFPRRIYMKIEFSSQRREMLLFLTTNIAAVTSRANQQYLRENKVLICQQGYRRRGERLNDNVTARQNNASDVGTCFLNLVHFLTDLCKTTFQNTN